MNNKRNLAIMATATLFLSSSLGFTGGYLASQYYYQNQLLPAEQSSISGVTPALPAAVSPISSDSKHLAQTASQGGMSVAEIANLAATSVVEIRTEVAVSGLRSRSFVTEGAGSGVIVSADGKIVTNNHVIEGAQKISVILKDGSNYAATLIATDAESDVALIKIEATGLAPAMLGDSSSLAVGDLAVAIGNPLGELGGTVTDGIISALDREITLDGETMNLLQTNAAINPGNSGGGLFNASGQLIGIVVAKSSGTGVEGLGFAIPINDVKTIMTDLERYGAVQGRVKLGVTLLDINSDELVSMYRVSEQGVYILKVDDNGNAARAGLASGDRIAAIDGQAVTETADVADVLKQAKAGQTLSVEIIRDGKTQTLDIALQASQPQV